MSVWQRCGCALAVLLVIGTEYRSIRTADFAYEDDLWTQACQPDPHATSIGFTLRGIPRSGAQASWCWQVRHGDTPFRFHLVNLGLHLSVAFLLGVLVFQLTNTESLAWAIGALFAAHPLAIESAGYLGGRGELLAGAGVLLACIAAWEGQYLAMLWAVCLGVLGKETALVAFISVPLVLSLKDQWFSTVVTLATLIVVGVALGSSLAVHLIHLPLGWRVEWALIQATAFVRLTTLAVIPWGQTPTHDYAGIGMFWQGLALVSMIGIIVTAWTHRITHPLWSVGAAWLVLTTLPRLVVPTPPSPLNEHQFYVPLMGMMLMLAAGLHDLSVRTA